MRSLNPTTKWFNYLQEGLQEDVDPNYTHRTYEIELFCRVSKTMGGNREQTEEDIRGVPRVTIVRPHPDPKRRLERATEEYFFMNYLVKFQLNSNISASWYIKNRLLPGLSKVRGLTLIRYARPVELGGGR